MRKMLRWTAGMIAALSLSIWLISGANTGWTKTSVVRWVHDPITELDGPVIENRFLPGIEMLGAALLGAAAILALSFFIPRNNRNIPLRNPKQSAIE